MLSWFATGKGKGTKKSPLFFFKKTLDKSGFVCYTKVRKQRGENKMTNLKPMNKIEEAVLEMVRAGKPIHGFAREILIEMTLRQMEEEEK